MARRCGAGRPTALWLALSFPPLLVNAITGQAGFLTAALFVAGMALLPKRPFAAGLLLGLLVVKPQLGLVLPLALLGGARMAGDRRRGRRRRSAWSCSASLLFGWGPWQAWLGNAGLIASIASEGLAGWHRMASVYGALRFAGLGAGPGLDRPRPRRAGRGRRRPA